MNEVAQDGLCEEDFTGDSIGKDREALGTWDSVEGRHQLSVTGSSTANISVEFVAWRQYSYYRDMSQVK